MAARDLDAVATIEASSLSPWSREQVAAELNRKTGLALVAVDSSGELQGWCCGLQAGTDVELLKITVSPARRRKGIGEALLETLASSFTKCDAERMFLEVRSRNSAALQLYAKLGWQETGRRKKYYTKPADDAVILVRSLKNDKA